MVDFAPFLHPSPPRLYYYSPCYVHASFYVAETWGLRKIDQKYVTGSQMWRWIKTEVSRYTAQQAHRQPVSTEHRPTHTQHTTCCHSTSRSQLNTVRLTHNTWHAVTAPAGLNWTPSDSHRTHDMLSQHQPVSTEHRPTHTQHMTRCHSTKLT